MSKKYIEDLAESFERKAEALRVLAQEHGPANTEFNRLSEKGTVYAEEARRMRKDLETMINKPTEILCDIALLAGADAPKGYAPVKVHSQPAYEYASKLDSAKVERETYLSGDRGALMIRETAMLNLPGVLVQVWHARPATKEELTAYLTEQVK